MTPDVVRVLRVLEYVGPRDVIEKQIIAHSLRDGTHPFRHGQLVVRVATIGDYPEILSKDNGQ